MCKKNGSPKVGKLAWFSLSCDIKQCISKQSDHISISTNWCSLSLPCEVTYLAHVTHHDDSFSHACCLCMSFLYTLDSSANPQLIFWNDLAAQLPILIIQWLYHLRLRDNLVYLTTVYFEHPDETTKGGSSPYTAAAAAPPPPPPPPPSSYTWGCRIYYIKISYDFHHHTIPRLTHMRWSTKTSIKCGSRCTYCEARILAILILVLVYLNVLDSKPTPSCGFSSASKSPTFLQYNKV